MTDKAEIPEAALRDAIDLANEEMGYMGWRFPNHAELSFIRAHARTLMKLNPEKYAPVDPALVFARKLFAASLGYCGEEIEARSLKDYWDDKHEFRKMLPIIREAIAFGEAQAKGAGKKDSQNA